MRKIHPTTDENGGGITRDARHITNAVLDAVLYSHGVAGEEVLDDENN
jgi:hypothetical protein